MTNNNHSAGNGPQRSREAALGWARALPATGYAITVVPADGCPSNVAHRRTWTAEQFQAGLGWLRHLNASHHHVVGRPIATQHVLVDDLSPAAAEALARHHQPAAIVASSPGNLQLWVTIADCWVEPEVAGEVARILATRHGGDRFAASARQPGRVPGLTNRKSKHRYPNGIYPYAMLLRADGPVVDPAGAALIEEAQAALARSPRRPPSTPNPTIPLRPGALAAVPPAEEHARGLARLRAALPPGSVLDRSRVDHAIAARLLVRGMPSEEVVQVVMAGEKAADLTAAAAEAYARRTVVAALFALNRRSRDIPVG